MTLLRHLTGRAAWLLLGGLLGALAWVHASGSDRALEGWLQSGQQEVQTQAKYRWDVRVLAGHRDALLHREAALARDTAQLSRNLQVAWHQVEGLVTSLDSLHRQPLTPEVRRYAEACGESINSCTERAGLLAQALETEHARANLATSRAAHADSVIAQGVRAQTCHFLLVFGCVSRAHAAELGLLGGVILTLVVRH